MTDSSAVTDMRFISLLVLLVTGATSSEIFITDAMKAKHKGGNKNLDAPNSFWTPNVVVTNNSTIILLAAAKYRWEGAQRDTFMGNAAKRSDDNGRTWTDLPIKGPPGTSQLIYSTSTDTLFLLGKSINMIDNGTRPEVRVVTTAEKLQ